MQLDQSTENTERVHILGLCDGQVTNALRSFGAEDELESVELSSFSSAEVKVDIDVMFSSKINWSTVHGKHTPGYGRVCETDNEAIELLRENEYDVIGDEQNRSLFRDGLLRWAENGFDRYDKPKPWNPSLSAAVWRHCGQCAGRGQNQCGRCNGYGQTESTCNFCMGHGTVYRDDASGSTSVSSYQSGRRVQCNMCMGAGKNVNSCSGCGGQGVVQCGDCSATGILSKVFTYSIQAEFHERMACPQRKVSAWIRSDGVSDTVDNAYHREQPTVEEGYQSDSVHLRCRIGYGEMQLQCAGESEKIEFYGKRPFFKTSSDIFETMLDGLLQRVKKSIEDQELLSDKELCSIPIISESMAKGFAESHKGTMYTAGFSILLGYQARGEIESAVSAFAAAQAGRNLQIASRVAIGASLLVSIAYALYVYFHPAGSLETDSRFAIVGGIVFVGTYLLCVAIRFWVRRRLLLQSRSILREESSRNLQRSGMKKSILLKRSLVTWAPAGVICMAALVFAIIALF